MVSGWTGRIHEKLDAKLIFAIGTNTSTRSMAAPNSPTRSKRTFEKELDRVRVHGLYEYSVRWGNGGRHNPHGSRAMHLSRQPDTDRTSATARLSNCILCIDFI